MAIALDVPMSRRVSFARKAMAATHGATTRPSIVEPALTMHSRRVRGHLLHWAEMGTGPAIVLLHGICDSHRTWLKAAPLLARNHRVIMLDLAGHGLSDRPNASYALEWHARLVGTWLDALGLAEVDVVGHSYGGGVALWMALLNIKTRIRKLALVAAGGLGKDVSFGLRLAALPLIVEHLGQPFMARATRIAMRVIANKIFDRNEVTHLAAMNAAAGSARAIARTLRDVIGLRGQQRHIRDRQEDLAALPPVGLFWGDRDPVIPMSHGTQAQEIFGGAQLTRFSACGHFPHREQPREFAAALERFIVGAESDEVERFAA